MIKVIDKYGQIRETEGQDNSKDMFLTSFNEVVISRSQAVVQSLPIYDILPNNFRTFTSLSGTAEVNSKMYTVTTGGTAFGYGAIQSFRSVNFNAGQSVVGRFVGLFEDAVANSWTGIGFVNISDELSFGYNGLDFGVWYRHGGVSEVRTIRVTAPSAGATNLTLTLNTVAYVIPLTAGTVELNAYEIAAWLNANQSVWVADQIDDTVIISAQSDGAKSGTYTYSHATSTGTITQNKAGVTKTSEHIPQADWDNPVTIDHTKLNNFIIEYGNGDARFFIENPDTNSIQLVHKLSFSNNRTTQMLNNPSMRFGIYAASVGSTTDIRIRCASVGIFMNGELVKTRNPRATKNTQSVTTSFTNVLTIRNRRTYNYNYNQVEIQPINLSISSEAVKNVEIEVRTNATFSGATDFTAVGNNLVSDQDTTANTVNGGVLLAAFTVSSNGTASVNLSSLDIRVPPSLPITISARVTSGAAANVTATLTYYEDV